MVYILAKIVTKHIKQQLIFNLRASGPGYNPFHPVSKALRQFRNFGEISLHCWRQKRASVYSVSNFSRLSDNLT
jgi:hypothetical protein